MSGTKKSFAVTKRLAPDYYPEFHCLMGDCRFSCCQGGWNIDFSRRDYLNMKQAARGTCIEALVGESTRRLRESEEKYAQFRLDDAGGCYLQRGDGLCRLQLACGERALPAVCREFPRTAVYTPAGYEACACSTGCEAVLYQLYQRREGLGFVEEPLKQKRIAEFCISDALEGIFEPLQELCIDILQDRRASLPRRFLLLGLVLKELDRRVRAEDTQGLEGWLARQRTLVEDPSSAVALSALPGNKPMFLLNNLDRLLALNPFNHVFRAQKATILDRFQVRWEDGGDRAKAKADLKWYLEAEQALLSRFGDLDFFYENIMVNNAFFSKFPLTDNCEAIWENYVTFCSTYSFFRFFVVSTAPENEQDLIQTLVLASRALLHNHCMTQAVTSKLFQNDSATLAHMAILVQG